MSSIASEVSKAAPETSSAIVALWRDYPRERKIGAAVLLAVGLWSVYKYIFGQPDGDAPAQTADDREGSLSTAAAADLKTAAKRYSKDFQELMHSTKAVPKETSNARPFIGFSLADNLVQGALIVDGVFAGGPADQTGVGIDHELLFINNEPVTSMDVVRQLVETHCRAGQVTRMTLRRNDDAGTEYEVLLWVMTADEKYRGKPYFFDTRVHEVRQSERRKQTWKPEDSPSR